MLRNVLGGKLNVSRVWIRKIINFNFLFQANPMIHPQGPFGLNPRMMNQLNMRMAAAAAAHAAQPPLGGPRGLRFPGSYFMWFDEKNNFEKKIHSKPQSIIEQKESSTPHIHTYTIKILSRKAFWYYIILK